MSFFDDMPQRGKTLTCQEVTELLKVDSLLRAALHDQMAAVESGELRVWVMEAKGGLIIELLTPEGGPWRRRRPTNTPDHNDAEPNPRQK